MSSPSILFVIGSLNIGGAERHLAQMLPLLAQRGWRPAVYCLMERGNLAPELERRGIPVHCTPCAGEPEPRSRAGAVSRIARRMIALARFMRAMKPAVAHFFLPYPYLVGAPAALIARVPVRIMSRRSLNNYQQKHPLSAALESMLHRTMTTVLGNSRNVVEQLAREGVPVARLGLIYNGIDIGPYGGAGAREDVRRAMNIDSSALVFVIVANLIGYKGHADLLTAFGRAQAQLPPGWRLLVVGRDDGIGPTLRAQAVALGLSENILFLGPYNDIPGVLGTADVGLLTSHQEGFSNALLEYMASGLAVVATDVGGNPEAVVAGESGLIVPPRDPERLAEALVRLGTDAALRRRLGDNARRRVADTFSIDTCLARYDALYGALTSGRSIADVPTVAARPEA
ncbi:MAG: glycosyltransferase [Pseudolabrys sp.]